MVAMQQTSVTGALVSQPDYIWLYRKGTVRALPLLKLRISKLSFWGIIILNIWLYLPVAE